MPCGAVTAKENNVVRILLRQAAQKEIRANCITVWHDQEAALPGGGLDGSVDITILPDVMAGDRRANLLRTLAEFGLVNPSKACLILEHQAHFSTVSIAIVDFFFQFACFSFYFLRSL